MSLSFDSFHSPDVSSSLFYSLSLLSPSPLDEDILRITRQRRFREMILQELRHIGTLNEVKPHELPTGIVVEINDFTTENGDLTATGKLVRPRLTEKYRHEIDMELVRLEKEGVSPSIDNVFLSVSSVEQQTSTQPHTSAGKVDKQRESGKGKATEHEADEEGLDRAVSICVLYVFLSFYFFFSLLSLLPLVSFPPFLHSHLPSLSFSLPLSLSLSACISLYIHTQVVTCALIALSHILPHELNPPLTQALSDWDNLTDKRATSPTPLPHSLSFSLPEVTVHTLSSLTFLQLCGGDSAACMLFSRQIWLYICSSLSLFNVRPPRTFLLHNTLSDIANTLQTSLLHNFVASTEWMGCFTADERAFHIDSNAVWYKLTKEMNEKYQPGVPTNTQTTKRHSASLSHSPSSSSSPFSLSLSRCRVITTGKENAHLLIGIDTAIGAHVLHNFLSLFVSGEREKHTLICLVSTPIVHDGQKTSLSLLKRFLSPFGLWSSSLEKSLSSLTLSLQFHSATLSLTHFGLSVEVYTHLLETVSDVWLLSEVCDSSLSLSFSSLRSHNILPVLECLRFLRGASNPKRLHFHSSTSVFDGVGVRRFSPLHPDTPNQLNPVSERESIGKDARSAQILHLDGYTQTKWVAERLLRNYCQEFDCESVIYRTALLSTASSLSLSLSSTSSSLSSSSAQPLSYLDRVVASILATKSVVCYEEKVKEGEEEKKEREREEMCEDWLLPISDVALAASQMCCIGLSLPPPSSSASISSPSSDSSSTPSTSRVATHHVGMLDSHASLPLVVECVKEVLSDQEEKEKGKESEKETANECDIKQVTLSSFLSLIDTTAGDDPTLRTNLIDIDGLTSLPTFAVVCDKETKTLLSSLSLSSSPSLSSSRTSVREHVLATCRYLVTNWRKKHTHTLPPFTSLYHKEHTMNIPCVEWEDTEREVEEKKKEKENAEVTKKTKKRKGKKKRKNKRKTGFLSPSVLTTAAVLFGAAASWFAWSSRRH